MERTEQSSQARAPRKQLAQRDSEDRDSEDSEPETEGVVRPNQRPRPRRLRYGSPGPPASHNDHEFKSRFIRFPQLPAELRLKIWEMYCPALTAPTRIIHLSYAKSGNMHAEDRQSFLEPHWLDKRLSVSTRRLRKVLAVHRESRQFALSIVPNTLYFSYAVPRPGAGQMPEFSGRKKQQKDFRTGSLKYNARQDIVDLEATIGQFSDILELSELANESFAKETRNVSLSLEELDDPRDHSLPATEAAEALRLAFPSLENIFCMSTIRPGSWGRNEPLEIKPWEDFELEEDLAWTKFPDCRKVTYKSYHLEVYHFPNFGSSKTVVSLPTMNDTLRSFKAAAEEKGIRFWPLTKFDYHGDWDRATKDASLHDNDLDYADRLGLINYDRVPNTELAGSALELVEMATAIGFEW